MFQKYSSFQILQTTGARDLAVVVPEQPQQRNHTVLQPSAAFQYVHLLV